MVEKTQADYGTDLLPYGFKSFEDAMNTIDPDFPNIGATYKIGGDIYRLDEINGKLEFIEVDDDE